MSEFASLQDEHTVVAFRLARHANAAAVRRAALRAAAAAAPLTAQLADTAAFFEEFDAAVASAEAGADAAFFVGLISTNGSLSLVRRAWLSLVRRRAWDRLKAMCRQATQER